MEFKNLVCNGEAEHMKSKDIKNKIVSDKKINESDEEKKLTGLNDEQVNIRIKEGKVNYVPKAPARTFGQILRANLFTSFNAINVVLAVIIILAGSPKNAIFVGVILVNTLIGVAQELRAKDILEKLSVISMAQAKVLRNGEINEIPIDNIVLDDVLYLETGMQVLADAEVIENNGLEVDESMLTGESDAIGKREGDALLSGSFIVAGECYARVNKVGKETYSSSLAEEAKQFKITNSELQSAINKIFKVLLWIIIPLTILLTVTQLRVPDATWQSAAIGTVSGIIGMIPEGLVLLTSATFIVSIIKLSKFDTLVQELCATEVLARVDVLCLDKTGTLTQGDLKLSEIKVIGDTDKLEVDRALAALVHNLPSKNPTQKAILDKYKEYDQNLKCIDKIPFSSKRKWGGLTFEGDLGSWILGAPEVILGKEYVFIKNMVEEEAKKGKRVLLLAKFHGEELSDSLLGKIESIALLLIEDIIREAAPDVLDYFNKQGVEVKIISGDSPVTVSEVARRAGVQSWNKYVDARELPEDDNEFKNLVKDTTVFGRVTPHQKKKIVTALQEMDHTVAMTGDGVNDVLALKASDCGIAMANGSDATKAVAQLVLMKSDFSALPKVLEEGRKQINNLERVSELFLSKTIYSILLAFVCSVMFLPYPILPIQLSLVGSCAIGIPAFFLAMLPSTGGVKKGFLTRVITVSIPNGIILAGFTVGTFLISLALGVGMQQSRTLALLMFAGISMVILFRVAKPLTNFKAVLCLSMFGIMILAFITPIGRYIFSLTTIKLRYWAISLAVIVLSGPLITRFVDFFRIRVNKKYKVRTI
ncbi:MULTISPECIES: cation-translocating P-type ATPase [Clostridium]|uniref:Calcium-transporting ATPase 1 n=1 Tax=Clostridium butyricum TaxID=1492 RepID=A0A6N3B2U8_CLOBU|nr:MULTISPECIES: cation-translocating P-type ATPase [Clostridium]ETI88405.1 MAG: P-type ATPase-metal cation transport [Clostridium butyricum DORA_1]ENZ30092.1 HAD ATPase, P-type, family IC [Clostridium butyricum 60E.3]MBZ5747598.1 cation-translocating P-type ATPase [Clostridium butyricum]MDU1116579.1 cation-translocating P-type ATPase [Clostridium sp.]MDU4800275.1 cation-translocating P-type ATPase [Clostridium butyricum]